MRRLEQIFTLQDLVPGDPDLAPHAREVGALQQSEVVGVAVPHLTLLRGNVLRFRVEGDGPWGHISVEHSPVREEDIESPCPARDADDLHPVGECVADVFFVRELRVDEDELRRRERSSFGVCHNVIYCLTKIENSTMRRRIALALSSENISRNCSPVELVVTMVGRRLLVLLSRRS